MTELRLILLVIGIVIVAAVYFFSTRGGAGAPASRSTPRRQAPQLGNLDGTEATTARAGPKFDGAAEESATYGRGEHRPDDDPEAAGPDEPAEQTASAVESESAAKAPQPSPDKIVMFHLLPHEDELFEASAVVSALRAEGLRYGHHRIFHRFLGEGNPGPDTVPVFSVANILKPGSFDLDTLEDTRLKGVSLVLVLPGPEEPVSAFADMLATGRRLAATLGGRLVDGTGSPVSRQAAGHMRDEIVNYQHASAVTQGKDVQHDLLS